MDGKAKEKVLAEQAAGMYFLSLMTPEKIQNSSGQSVDAWVLSSNPTQLQVEEKVLLERKLNDGVFSWDLKFDETGGDKPKQVHVTATFDQNGNLLTIGGLHGTVTTAASLWRE